MAKLSDWMGAMAGLAPWIRQWAHYSTWRNISVQKLTFIVHSVVC